MAKVKKTKKRDVASGDHMTAVLTRATGKAVEPYKRIPINDCVPNDWNQNVMSPDLREKLAAGIKMLMDQVNVLPPIVVRPHPDPKQGKYQIIDGYHRWDILRTMDFDVIDAYVIDVDTKTAMILTDTLNYLRGEPDPELHVKYLQRLLTEGHMQPADAAEYLPQTASEIEDTLDAFNIHIDHIEIPEEEGAGGGKGGDDQLMEMKFYLYRSQAEVVEHELSRVGGMLTGKNIRGRALEFICVNSSQTPVESIIPAAEPEEHEVEVQDDEEDEKPKPFKTKLKKKLRANAA